MKESIASAAVDVNQPRQALERLARLLSGYAYRFRDERELHDAMSDLLLQHGFDHAREHSADARNRLDFWLEDLGIVIEVKVDGSLSQALRQIARYSTLSHVRGVLLAATPVWAARAAAVTPAVGQRHSIPIAVAHLRRQSL